MKRQLVYPEQYWDFAREVLLEIKKQQEKKLKDYPSGDSIAFNVALLLDRETPITIENFGKY